MASKRSASREIFLISIFVLGILEAIQSKHFDEACVERYSASYSKSARQSENQNRSLASSASYAVDGYSKTCSKTPQVGKSWWEVDLEKEINVSTILIKNSRSHAMVLLIYILQELDGYGKSCGIRHVLEGGETRLVRCVPVRTGRVVKMVKNSNNDSLSLCEVHVFDEMFKITEGVRYQAWLNINFKSFGHLNSKPISRGVLPSFQAPSNLSDHYGIKMVTFYNAPESGNYTFKITCDRYCRLYLRSLKDIRARAIAKVSLNMNEKERSDSVTVPLEKDNVYELTAVMNEDSGTDYLRVGVVLPSGLFEEPLKQRIFTDEKAALALTKNTCSPDEILPEQLSSPVIDKVLPTASARSTESAIATAMKQLQGNDIDGENKFQIFNHLEELGLIKAKSLLLDQNDFVSYVLHVKNVVFAAVAVNLTKFNGFKFFGSLENSSFSTDGCIFFPDTTFRSNEGRASIVLLLFKPFKFMERSTGSEYQLASNVLTAIVVPDVITKMTKPIKLVFRNTKDMNTKTRHCVFWIEDNKYSGFNYSDRDVGFGRWSNEGCSLVNQNDTHTTCQCNHLTKFALLFPVAEGSKKDESNLELITYIGLSLSSAGCFLTFAAYFILRVAKSLKTIVHMNLVAALGLADIAFLFGNFAEKHKNICFACTVLTFYLYLAVFSWMLIEGIHLYFLVIRVFGRNNCRRKQCYFLIGWGVPLLIVVITSGIFRYDLMSKKHCWLSAENAVIWVFVGLALLVIVVNTLVLGAVLRTTLTVLRKDPGHRKEKSAMRTLAMLVPILGITWVFGLVAFANDSIVFQYVFAVCNVFQGFFIFLLYCLFNNEVRQEYEKKRKTWKTEREIETKRSKPISSY